MNVNVPTNKVYLALGSNLGDKAAYIQKAILMIEQQVGPVEKISQMYTTKAEGFESENEFMNAALCVHTHLSANDLLLTTQQIEKLLGRTQKSQNGRHFDRCIDIDILYYNMEQINLPNLIVPHPRMHLRGFVLQPLCDIAPKLKHPIVGKSTQAMLSSLH